MRAELNAPSEVAQRDHACPIASTQLAAILERTWAPGMQYVRVVGRAEQILAECAHELDQQRPASLAAPLILPVIVHGDPVAELQIWGPVDASPLLGHTAKQTAAWIADVWQAAREISSLAGEVVHAYEELHLLYELSDALAGQLSVANAARLLLEKVVDALDASWAELRFAGTTPLCVHHGERRRRTERRGHDQRLRALLRMSGESVGEIVIARAPAAAAFSSADTKLLDAVGSLGGNALRNAQRYEDLRKQADTDALTGLINHRAFQEELDRGLANAADEKPLAVLMIDIDDFKLFNDTYGHAVGDQILRLVADALRQSSRTSDVIARYGGDEFIMILPQTDRSGAVSVGQRILRALQACDISVTGRTSLPLALSIGCAVYPHDAVLKHDLLSHADAALYEIKRRGGNGVHVSGLSSSDPAVEGTTFSALEGLVNAVDAKDRYTREHSDMVTQGALLLARRLHLPADTCSALRIAGLLHDVGKIGIPDHILRKPGPLDSDEYAVMQQHVSLSELIIKEVPHLVDVLSAVASHHERFDGTGYPRGLRGEEIPLLGRIMALADACSAMLLNRPYRKGMHWPAIAAELRRGAGTQFDPAFVEPFISSMEESGLLVADTNSPPSGSQARKSKSA